MSQKASDRKDDEQQLVLTDKTKIKGVTKQPSRLSIKSEANEAAFKRVNDLKNLRISKQKSDVKPNKTRQASAEVKGGTASKTSESRSSTQLTMNSNEHEKAEKIDEKDNSQNESDNDDDEEEGAMNNKDDGLILRADEDSLENIDFTKIDKTKRELERKRDIALRYLCSQKDLSLILDTQQGRDMLRFIYKLTMKVMKLIYYVIQTSYYKQMILMLEYQYENVIESLQKDTFDDVAEEGEEVDGNEIYVKLDLLKTQLLTIMNMTNRSIEFCLCLHETNAIHILLKYITNEFFLDVLAGRIQLNKKCATLLKNLIRISLGSLHNMTKAKDKYVDEWARSNAARILLDLSKRLGEDGVENPSIRNSIYMTVANIATEDEIESLKDIQLVLKEIIYIFSMCVKQFKKGLSDYSFKRLRLIVFHIRKDLNQSLTARSRLL